MKGLPTKKKYRFRVLAENLAGPGKPSTETDPILVKDPIGMIWSIQVLFQYILWVKVKKTCSYKTCVVF